jgi:hypothetical protein
MELTIDRVHVDGDRGGPAFVSAASLLLSAIPLLGGLRLAHAGDPEMGRRFVSDLRARVGQLRHPIGLVRTSAGFWRDSCPSPSASDCWGQGSTA